MEEKQKVAVVEQGNREKSNSAVDTSMEPLSAGTETSTTKPVICGDDKADSEKTGDTVSAQVTTPSNTSVGGNEQVQNSSSGQGGDGITRNDKVFLAPPPPASTLLIRRSGTGNNNGTSTYVVGAARSSATPQPSVEEEEDDDDEDIEMTSPPPTNINTFFTKRSGKGSFSSSCGKDSSTKRKPGRPVGSVGPYKRKKMVSEGDYSTHTGEVRVSSRMSTSIFKHDILSASGIVSVSHHAQDNSPWIYPSVIRTPQVASGGKPPMAGFRKPYSKGYKREKESSLIDNIDPLTGKRRYTRRKKIGNERRDTFDDFSGESEPEGDKLIKFHLSENGVWRPTDDLRLMVNMRVKNDLERVYYGVKFSCFFSFRDIQERWRRLLYNAKANLVSQNAINVIHPDVKSKIYHESVFSPEEEYLVSTVKVSSDGNPDIKIFQEILENNPHIFLKHRTARRLLMHWLDMKDYYLLPNQNPLEYKPGQTLEDYEDCVCESRYDMHEDIDSESVLMELASEERNLKKKLRLLDEEINAWQVITGQIIEDGMKSSKLPPLPTDFDGKTFALLRGKEVCFGMTSREIILGRSTKDCKVDADLSEEGSSSKISRKQAIIRLKRMGRFVIINKGKRPIFVNKKAVLYRCAAVLHDQAVIQIAQINLIFFINEALIARVIERDVSGEIYASFQDLENESLATSSKSALPSTLTAPRQYSTLYPSSNGAIQSQVRAHGTGDATTLSNPNTNVNDPSLGANDGTCEPICQPPASYITI